MKRSIPPSGRGTSDPGFMPLAEGAALVDVASLADADLGPFLEVGSYSGRSASYLGPVARQLGSFLFCVDRHRHIEAKPPGRESWGEAESRASAESGPIDTLPLFRQTMIDAELDDSVVAIVGESATVAEFWNRTLSLLFLNGGRSIDEVKADYSGWVEKVAVGGLLIINDVRVGEEDETVMATYEYLYLPVVESGEFEELRSVGSLRIMRRVAGPKLVKPVDS